MMGLCWQFHRARLIRTMFNKALFKVQITEHFIIIIIYLFIIYLFISLTAII